MITVMADEGEFAVREAEAVGDALWLPARDVWRQRTGVNELGLASPPDFWARVDALGDKRYDARVAMKGMP